MNIKYTKTIDTAKLNAHAHETDAGLDLLTPEAITLAPGIPVKIDSGIAVAIPAGYVGLIWDKSSIGAMGIKVCGGVIDAGYRGSVIITLINCTNEPISFPAGKKIAQLIVQPYVSVVPIEVSNFDDDTTRGESGFGSTGQ